VHTISRDRYEWDPNKSAANEAKPGISLSDATAIWIGTVASVLSLRSGEEQRHLAVGIIDGKHWTVVFT
jgi:hypothetical protein